jgi:hypothetical protein
VPRQDWSAKRERQYAHIKEGLVDRGDSTDEAEEIAARTVNKSRARSGETKTASRTSLNDISSGRRGGLRSHKGAGGRTRDQLYEEAPSEGERPVDHDEGAVGTSCRSLSGSNHRSGDSDMAGRVGHQ